MGRRRYKIVAGKSYAGSKAEWERYRDTLVNNLAELAPLLPKVEAMLNDLKVEIARNESELRRINHTYSE